MNITAALREYAEQERNKFDSKWNNPFAFSVGHANSFARYLDHVLERYVAAIRFDTA